MVRAKLAADVSVKFSELLLNGCICLLTSASVIVVPPFDVENVKQVRKVIGEVDDNYLEAFDEESMEPAEAGHITLTVKTTDKNRSDVIRDLELVSAAIDKLNLA